MTFNRVLLASFLVVAVGCHKNDVEPSKPVSCEVAGKMVAKRVGEFADKANITGDRRTKLDSDIAAAVATRCTEDKWDDVPLGCLGAVATIKEGTIPADKYNDAIDVCTKAIGDDKWKKMEGSVGQIVRALKQP